MSQATRILLALIAGLLIGIAAAAFDPARAVAATALTQPIGLAWLHGLQMVIVPLIMGLLVTGVGAAANAARAGRIALRSVISFVVILWTTTFMSALVMPLLLDLWPLPEKWSHALRLAPLLFVRPGELRTAEWSEIDLDAATWRVPAAKMKMARNIQRERRRSSFARSANALIDLGFLIRRGEYQPPARGTLCRDRRSVAFSNPGTRPKVIKNQITHWNLVQ